MSQKLRELVSKTVVMLATLKDPAQRKRDADYALGWWLAAALDDAEVCVEMKAEIIGILGGNPAVHGGEEAR